MPLRIRWPLVSLLAFALLAACAKRSPAAPIPPEIAIALEIGAFPSVEAAAAAYDSVDWWDGDTRDDDACTTAFAALELRAGLARALGIEPSAIALWTARSAPRAPTVILLGGRAAPAHASRERSAAPESAESFRVRAAIGDGVRVIRIEGASRVGTLYGVYALLERLGVRAYGMGDDGIVGPEVPASLPDSLDLRESPAFETRGFWAWEPRGNDEFFVWMARNRLNLWTDAEPAAGRLAQLGIRRVAGGHGVQGLLLDPRAPATAGGAQPESRPRFEAHPDWYGLVAGRRALEVGPEIGVNFCTSSPGAVAEFCHGLVEQLAAGAWKRADVVALWMHDNGRWCECDACRALGAPTDRLLRLAATALDSVRAARESGRLHRPVTLTSLAFLETQPPPRAATPPQLAGDDFALTWFPIYRCYAHPIADPSCVEINASQSPVLEAWSRAARAGFPGRLEIGEYYGLGELHLLPLVLSGVIPADLRTFRALGVRRFHYMHVPTRRWGPWTLTHALLARLLWDPDRDPGAIGREFFAGYYPGTGDTVALAYRDLETAMANIKLLMHRVQVGRAVYQLSAQLERGGGLFPLRHLQRSAADSPTDEAPDLARMEAASRDAVSLLESCERRATAPAERARLADDLARARHARATVAFFAALMDAEAAERDGAAARGREAWSRLERAAGELRVMVDVVHGSASHAESEDAFEATGMADEYARLAALYGEGRHSKR